MANRYWVGGAGTWNTSSTTNWSATSGGSSGASAPTSADNVFFDNNSGGVFYIVTLSANVTVNSLTMSGTLQPRITGNTSTSVTCLGNCTVSSTALTSDSTMGYLSVGGNATSVLTSGGYTFPFYVFLGSGSSSNSVTLADTFVCTKDVQYASGILNLNNNTLTCVQFSSSNTNTRQLQFGTGSITATGLGTLISTTYSIIMTGTNFTYTGSGQLYATYIAGAKLIGLSTGWTESNSLNVTPTLSSFGTTTGPTICKNLTTVGTGVISISTSQTIYGDLTLSSGTTYTISASVTFAATSGTKTITTNGVVIPANVTINAPGATYNLGSSFECTGTSLTLTAGTFNANNYNVTCTSFSSSNSNVRALTMGSGVWTLTGGNWSLSTSTNLTLTASTSTVNMASATSKSFSGGGLTYYIVNQAGAGGLTISQSNTFNTIGNTYAGASTITFQALLTQTVTNFTAAGTAGNILTLVSLSPGFKFTISKSSGQVLLDYVSITDSIATGGARFYAGVHSTNGGNNTGWIFSSPSAGASGFFRLFPI